MFKTAIMTLNSGIERRNINWSHVRAEYECAHAVKLVEEAEELRHFFYGRRGRAHSFRFKDHSDYRCEAQTLAVADGVKTVYQFVKTYDAFGFEPYHRQITKLVVGSVQDIKFDGVVQNPAPGEVYTISHTAGTVTFVTPPAEGVVIGTTSFEFDVHARFDTDKFDIQYDDVRILSWGSIPIVEVKGAV